jgi:hypothetical protein
MVPRNPENARRGLNPLGLRASERGRPPSSPPRRTWSPRPYGSKPGRALIAPARVNCAQTLSLSPLPLRASSGGGSLLLPLHRSAVDPKPRPPSRARHLLSFPTRLRCARSTAALRLPRPPSGGPPQIPPRLMLAMFPRGTRSTHFLHTPPPTGSRAPPTRKPRPSATGRPATGLHARYPEKVRTDHISSPLGPPGGSPECPTRSRAAEGGSDGVIHKYRNVPIFSPALVDEQHAHQPRASDRGFGRIWKSGEKPIG